MQKVIRFLLYAVFFTSSFDIFGELNVGGFNLKLSYVIILVLIFLSLLRINQFQFKFKGFLFFGVWAAFLLLFIGNTQLLSRNIVYYYSLCQFACIVLILADLVRSKADFYKIQKVYLSSFFWVAVFGLLQLICGIAGFSLLTQTWWIPGVLPRVNGFSYEPSYFATYLLIGWCYVYFLLYFDQVGEIEKMGLKKKTLKLYLYIITASILLSSSRMGFVFVVAISSMFFVAKLFSNVFRKGIITRIQLIACVFATTLIIAVTPALVSFYDTYSFLLAGTGLGDTSSHSLDDRNNGLLNTIDVAKESVFMGVSLGGIPSAIAENNGIVIENAEQAKGYEGFNILVEVFAASSLAGYIFFLLYFGLLFKTLLARSTFPQENLIAKALALALLFEILILCLNQNILRPYLWLHIAMVNSFIFIKSSTLSKRPLSASNGFQIADQ